ncbi:hypothetical protein [Nostoc sp.]|uniref:hypothetical protein n=1 Tax=Nostoc sp. TaxID=1180 RepID=UPI002FF9B5EC
MTLVYLGQSPCCQLAIAVWGQVSDRIYFLLYGTPQMLIFPSLIATTCNKLSIRTNGYTVKTSRISF